MSFKLYRKILFGTVFAAVAALIGYCIYYVNVGIPEYIRVESNVEEKYNFRLPVTGTVNSESQEVVLGTKSNIASDRINLVLDEDFSIYAEETGKYQLQINVFGFIHLKNVTLDVVEKEYVIPCGIPVGIFLETDGIMVIGTANLQMQSGETVASPATGLIQTGDYITKVNGVTADSKDILIEAVKNCGGMPLQLTVRSEDGTMKEVSISPVLDENGEYKLGIWVRDDTQGIGTLTYITQDGEFGALGHSINDSDSGKLVQVSGGVLYAADIKSVMKGSFGSPGSLAGVICYGADNRYGEIEDNTSEGIFGSIDRIERTEEILSDDIRELVEELEPLPVCSCQNIETGTAYVRSAVSGEIKDYEIEITKLNYNLDNQNKGIVFKVTDEEMLEISGGIVQGMSGSPIIQNGKIIGAVTHVFVNDPTRGYGIFIEEMLEE